MAEAKDDWGYIIAGIVLVGGAVWVYNNYTIERKNKTPPTISMPPLETRLREKAPPPRPAGLIYITELDSGTVWRVDADSVTGPRTARMIWKTADHSKDRSTAARETQTLYRANCDTSAYRTLKIVQYGKDGKLINSWGAEVLIDADDYPPPGSNIAAVIRAGCDSGFDPPPQPGK